MTKQHNKVLRFTFAALLALLITTPVQAEKILKASHQWPGGKGDVRDEMVQMIARDVNAAKVGIKIQVYPAKSLYKPKEQWGAMTKGELDITAFPLAYAGGRHPEFNLTLMPGLVKNHDHALRLNKSRFMKRIKKIMNDADVIVLADTWLAGGFVSKKKCILNPEDAKGQTFRAAASASVTKSTTLRVGIAAAAAGALSAAAFNAGVDAPMRSGLAAIPLAAAPPFRAAAPVPSAYPVFFIRLPDGAGSRNGGSGAASTANLSF